MPKATPQITSPPAGPPTPDTPTTSVIPSILAIGRMIRAVDGRTLAIDSVMLQSKDRRPGMEKELNRLNARSYVLADLAATLPAQSLPDVAVQLAVAFTLIEQVTESESDERDARRALRKLRRIVCGAFPLVIGAAGMDADEIATPDFVELMAHEFGEHAV